MDDTDVTGLDNEEVPMSVPNAADEAASDIAGLSKNPSVWIMIAVILTISSYLRRARYKTPQSVTRLPQISPHQSADCE